MSIVEQQFADNTGQFVGRVLAFRLVFDEGEQQIVDLGGPDVSHDDIFGCAEEGRDFQILLDSFEEDFDLPPRYVQFRDGGGIEDGVVGHDVSSQVVPGSR